MSKDKNNGSNKEIQMSEENLQKSIIQLKQLIKSLRLSLPKEARRLQSISSVLKNSSFLNSCLKDNISDLQNLQRLVNLSQYSQYKQLLCSQSLNRFQQIYHQLEKLSLEYKKVSLNVKMKKEQLNIIDFVNKFNEIKLKFTTVWRQQYFLILNYRMDITAKDLQRWSYMTLNKFDKQKTTASINNLFN